MGEWESLNKNVVGRTLLMHASYEGDVEKISALLEEGSDPNARDESGDTALMFASLGGHFLIVKMLLAHGADVTSQAKNGWTALQAARSRHHSEVINLLERAEEKAYRDGLARLDDEFGARA